MIQLCAPRYTFVNTLREILVSVLHDRNPLAKIKNKYYTGFVCVLLFSVMYMMRTKANCEVNYKEKINEL